MKQVSFVSLNYQSEKKQTRREKFLADMDRVVPLRELVLLIEPHNLKSGRCGRKQMPLESMLRTYFMRSNAFDSLSHCAHFPCAESSIR